MATPANRTYRELVGRISRAQSTFRIAALGQLYPALKGQALAEALGRERQRDTAYARNMRARMRRGVSAIFADPTLTEAERGARIEGLARLERSYLERHISAAGRRMAKEAELERLLEREAGGVWVLGRTKVHTPDCLAMAGRWWPESVLRKINPANRHNGCDCSVVSEAQARARGIPVRRGYVTTKIRREFVEGIFHMPDGDVVGFWREEDDEALEEIEVSVRGHFRMSKSGKRVWVDRYTRTNTYGNVSAVLDASLTKYLDEVASGRPDRIDAAHAAFRKDALSLLPKGEEQDEALRTGDRIRQAAYNPRNLQTRVGEPVEPGSDSPGMPVAPVEREGVRSPWSDRGTFAWVVPSAGLSEGLRASLKDSRSFRITTAGDDSIVETSRRVSEDVAQASARALELSHPSLRRLRYVAKGEILDDDRPIDVHDLEPRAPGAHFTHSRGRRETGSIYVGISREQIGQAGEATIRAVAARLHELGMVDADDDVRWPTAGQKDTAIDWVLGKFMAEVKAEPWRGITAGRSKTGESEGRTGGHGIDEAAKMRKLGMLRAENAIRKQSGREPAEPVMIQLLTDLDHGQVHVIMTRYVEPKHRYTKDEQANLFTSRRWLTDLVTDITDGKAVPGQAYTPKTGSDAWKEHRASVYLGTFSLPLNPLRRGTFPVDPDTGERRHLSREELLRVSGLPDAPGPGQGIARVGDAIPGTARRAQSLDVLPEDPSYRPPRRSPRRQPEPRAPKTDGFTDRDKEVVAALRAGDTQGAIAKRFNMSQSAVSGIKTKWERETGESLGGGRGTRNDLKKRGRWRR